MQTMLHLMPHGTRRTTPGGAEAAEAAAPLTGGGGYLRQIAAVHDHQHQQQLKAVEGGAALFFDLQSTLQHCVSQLVMPAVKVCVRVSRWGSCS